MICRLSWNVNFSFRSGSIRMIMGVGFRFMSINSGMAGRAEARLISIGRLSSERKQIAPVARFLLNWNEFEMQNTNWRSRNESICTKVFLF